jgi:hypothetical protein
MSDVDDGMVPAIVSITEAGGGYGRRDGPHVKVTQAHGGMSALKSPSTTYTQSKSPRTRRPRTLVCARLAALCCHGAVLIMWLFVGIFFIGVGLEQRFRYVGYFPCECQGLNHNFTSIPSSCSAGISLDSILSWIGMGTTPSIEYAPTEPPSGVCLKAVMNCVLSCEGLEVEYPVSTVQHLCRHAPVASADLLDGACADDFNTPVVYYINPCAWDMGRANTTSHGPYGYSYDDSQKICSAAVDKRPKLLLQPHPNIGTGYIVVGSLVIFVVGACLAVKCGRCVGSHVKKRKMEAHRIRQMMPRDDDNGYPGSPKGETLFSDDDMFEEDENDKL